MAGNKQDKRFKKLMSRMTSKESTIEVLKYVYALGIRQDRLKRQRIIRILHSAL